jgi:hypothetical protein
MITFQSVLWQCTQCYGIRWIDVHACGKVFHCVKCQGLMKAVKMKEGVIQ